MQRNFGKLFVNSRVVKKRRIDVVNVFGLTFTHLYTIVVFTILPHLVTVAFAYTDCTFLKIRVYNHDPNTCVHRLYLSSTKIRVYNHDPNT